MFRSGLGLGQQYREGEEGASCDQFYKDQCSIQEWNEFVIGYRRLVAKSTQAITSKKPKLKVVDKDNNKQ